MINAFRPEFSDDMPNDPDAFMNDKLAPIFMHEAFEAHDSNGEWHIPDQKKIELRAIYGLTEAQTAAYSYLAQNRAQENSRKLEKDLLDFEYGGGL